MKYEIFVWLDVLPRIIYFAFRSVRDPTSKVIHIDRIISPFFEIEYFLNFLVPLFLNKSVLSIPVFKSVDFPTKQVERST